MSTSKKEAPFLAWPPGTGSYADFYEVLVTLSLESPDDGVAVAALKMQGACNAAFGRPGRAHIHGIPIKGVPMK